MYIGPHVKYLLFLSYFNEIGISIAFKKYSNKKFHEYTSSGSLVDLCEETDGWTERQK